MNSTGALLARLQAGALLCVIVLVGLFVWAGGQPVAAGLVPPPWDKLVHLAWFAVLAGLLHFAAGLRWGSLVAALCVSLGLWDEWRQLSLAGRAAGWDDLLFDVLGVGAGMALAVWGGRRLLGRV